MLSGIYSVPFWHCILPFYLEFVLAFFLVFFSGSFCHFFVRFICLSILIISDYYFFSTLTSTLTRALPNLNRERQISMGSARVWRSQWGSGNAYWDLELAGAVRQCPLRSAARCYCPAVHSAIWSSQLRSGSAHWDGEFAIGSCATEIWNFQLRAHWDLEFGVEIRQCSVRPWGHGWGPAVPTESLTWAARSNAEEGGGRRRKEEEGGRRRKEEEGGGRRRKKEEGGGRRRKEEGGGRRREEEGEGRRQETLIKSKDPQLAGGENHDKITASPLQKPAMEQTHDIWLQAHRTENKKSMRKNINHVWIMFTSAHPSSSTFADIPWSNDDITKVILALGWYDPTYWELFVVKSLRKDCKKIEAAAWCNNSSGSEWFRSVCRRPGSRDAREIWGHTIRADGIDHDRYEFMDLYIFWVVTIRIPP